MWPIFRRGPCGKILGIASATGAQCRMLGRAGIEATGLDLSEPMIAGAHRGALRNVHYVQGSSYALPFADADFYACSHVTRWNRSIGSARISARWASRLLEKDDER